MKKQREMKVYFIDPNFEERSYPNFQQAYNAVLTKYGTVMAGFIVPSTYTFYDKDGEYLAKIVPAYPETDY